MKPQADQKWKKIAGNLARKRSKIFLVISMGALIYGIAFFFSSVQNAFSPLSIVIAFAMSIMIGGQLLTDNHYSFIYPLYFLSCTISVAFSLFFWTSIRGIGEVYYLSIILYLIIIIAAHFKTRERYGMIDNSSTFSIVLFALMIVLSSGSLPESAADTFFWISLILFSIVSMPLLNAAYRTIILNRELKIRNIDDYLEDSRKKLLNKFSSKIDDVEMLLFYAENALSNFIDGDFEGSFMEAYKIVFDGKGEAFKEIYVRPKTDDGSKFSEIRAKLAHAKGRDSTLEELKVTKKELYKNTLRLVKILKQEFIDCAIESH